MWNQVLSLTNLSNHPHKLHLDYVDLPKTSRANGCPSLYFTISSETSSQPFFGTAHPNACKLRSFNDADLSKRIRKHFVGLG